MAGAACRCAIPALNRRDRHPRSGDFARSVSSRGASSCRASAWCGHGEWRLVGDEGLAVGNDQW